MTDVKPTAKNADEPGEEIGPLIRLAGIRETVSPEQFGEAHRRVAAHWQEVVARRRQRRSWQAFAVAASLVAAVAIGTLAWRVVPQPLDAPVAAVTRVLGDVYADGEPALRGATIPPGAMIQTADGAGIALALSNGHSMRIDRLSRIVALGGERFRLEQGAVYVDSGAGVPENSVFIETPYGIATDVGTQFQLRVAADGLTVGVREGLVELARASEAPVSVPTGRVYRLAPSGEATLQDYDRDGPLWDWVALIAPDFDIDGATLRDYLDWYARERGLALEWADATSASRAADIRLSGSIAGLSLDDGIDTVKRIAPFEYEQRGEALRIRVE